MRVERARRKYTVMLQKRNEGLSDVGTEEETNVRSNVSTAK
jgi:hypothetical protein